MKTIKLTLEVECTDSACISDIVSDVGSDLLYDDVKKCTIEYEENGTLQTEEFENPDFEED